MLIDGRSKMNPIKVLIDSFILMELAFLWSQVNGSDASCTPEQVQRCKSEAQGGSLSKLGAGGQCEKQQYVHYTHTCTLNLFLPDVDYCCCAYERKVLCCRYHQSHDRYRCSLPEDTIATLSEGLPLKYLLPLILVPIFAVGCCVVCCVKCCLHNEDCDEIRNCWRNKDKKKMSEIEDTSSSPMTGFHQSSSYQFPSSHGSLALGQFEREPLNNPNNHFHQMIMPMDPPKRPLEELMEGDRLMPSAPGSDEGREDPTPYMRSVSAPPINEMTGMPFEPCNGDFTHIHCGPLHHRHHTQNNGSHMPAHHHHHQNPTNQHPHPHNPHPHPHNPHHNPSSHGRYMHQPSSYPGSIIDRQESAINNISAPARGNGNNSGSGGGGDGTTGGDRSSHCPNCSAKPPTYTESFQHPVMDQQLSRNSNHSGSPPFSAPGSPGDSS